MSERALVVALMVFLGACAKANADPEPAAGSETIARASHPPPASPAPRPAPAPRVRPPLVEPEPEMPGRTPPIEFPEALSGFYAALARTEARQGITRVTHLGDSSIGLDQFPHPLREAFQQQFGDAGPGFVLLQRHSGSYLNKTVTIRTGTPWNYCFIIHRCRRDGHYGLGGVTVDGPTGATSVIAPLDGRLVTRAELWYAGQPNGGRLSFRFGEGEPVEIDTNAPQFEDRWQTLQLPSGSHPVRVRAEGGGPMRAYGVVLENEGPGVVWDSLSMIGAFTHRLLAHDEAHFASQLQHRHADLVILNYGGNDLRRLVGGVVDEPGLQEEIRQVLTRVKTALPNASCLLMGINDHEMSGNLTVRPRHVEAVIGAQRAAAQQAGCAFWDLTAAMGGPGSFGAWLRHGLAAGDYKHLSPRGRRVMAARFHAALLNAR